MRNENIKEESTPIEIELSDWQALKQLIKDLPEGVMLTIPIAKGREDDA